MAQEEVIKLFDSKKVRIVWDDEEEKYYFFGSGCHSSIDGKR